MARTSPAKFVRQVRGEISRITWATRRDTLTSTITVLIMENDLFHMICDTETIQSMILIM